MLACLEPRRSLKLHFTNSLSRCPRTPTADPSYTCAFVPLLYSNVLVPHPDDGRLSASAPHSSPGCRAQRVRMGVSSTNRTLLNPPPVLLASPRRFHLNTPSRRHPSRADRLLRIWGFDKMILVLCLDRAPVTDGRGNKMCRD